MGKTKIRNGREEREERERIIKLKYKYEHRITIAKFGKEFLDSRDYTNALAKFIEYLKIMAEVKETGDYYTLSPANFDPKKDLTEMLMISHIFFEMARIYDASPKFLSESEKCINQFIAFTINQPYQVVNSELIRKFLKKSLIKNEQVFKNAYQQIFVQSKKCYVVTFCYGHHHPITQNFRNLKEVMLESQYGCEMIRVYYLLSSRAVERWEKSYFMKLFAHIVFKPLLALFSKTLLPFIIKK